MEDNKKKFCRICTHKKRNLKTGLYCGLTNLVPKFDKECPSFDLDKEALVYSLAVDVVSTNSGRVELIGNEFHIHPWAKVNGELAGAVLGFILMLLIFPLAIWHLYNNMLVGYYIDISNGNLYKLVLGKKELLMNMAQLKDIQLESNYAGGLGLTLHSSSSAKPIQLLVIKKKANAEKFHNLFTKMYHVCNIK